MEAEKKEINWIDYPMTLRPKHIEQIMKMSQKKTYEFLGDAPFHVARAGRDIYISKNVFRNWLEGTNLDTIPVGQN
ncbi:DNA-binding protein [Paenibacillus sp. FSL W8-0426]|uniref:DNA-binding protein n=1 Tax=Paenibacillus sp. FSL W8-0426 TaxID=2921714 RepID=UPI0030DD7262